MIQMHRFFFRSSIGCHANTPGCGISRYILSYWLSPLYG